MYAQRPTQFRRPTTLTMMTSRNKYYGQSRRQSTHQAPISFRHSARIKRKLPAQAPMATVEENVESGSIQHRNTGFGEHSSRSTIPLRSVEMQFARAIVHGSATSIGMIPRLFKRLGIPHQAARIVTLSLTAGVMQHAKDSRKTRITV